MTTKTVPPSKLEAEIKRILGVPVHVTLANHEDTRTRCIIIHTPTGTISFNEYCSSIQVAVSDEVEEVTAVPSPKPDSTPCPF